MLSFTAGAGAFPAVKVETVPVETFSCSKSRQKSIILVNAMSIFTERGQRRELCSGNVSSGEEGGISSICICAGAIPANPSKFRNIQESFEFQPYSPHLFVPLHHLLQQFRAHLQCLEAMLDASSSLGVTSRSVSGDPVMVAAETAFLICH